MLLSLSSASYCLGQSRIAATYTVFNHTSDEPAHIACGMQWLDRHIYQYEHQHPPLTRVMVAIGPYLAGARGTGENDMTVEGNAILYGVQRLRSAAGAFARRKSAVLLAGMLDDISVGPQAAR